MIFNVNKISFIYDPLQDRLNLLCHNSDNEQQMIVLTRQLFKELLGTLPKWLNDNKIQMSCEGEDEVEKFVYESEQEQVETNVENITIQSEITAFLAYSMNLSSMKDSEKIVWTFFDEKQNFQTRLMVNLPEFQTIFTTLFEKIPNWDLDNPWPTNIQTPLTTKLLNKKIVH